MVKKRTKRKTIHIEYSRAYHEVLKYEDILDFDIDHIFQTFLKVIAELREERDLDKYPLQEDIDKIVTLVIEKLRKEDTHGNIQS